MHIWSLNRTFLLGLLIFTCFSAVGQSKTPSKTEALITISVVDNLEIPEQDAVIIFKEIATDRTYKGITDSAGAFELILTQGKKFVIMVSKYDYEFDFGEKEIPKMDGPIEINMKFKIGLDSTSYEDVYTLDNVYFDYDKASLRAESFKELDELVEAMNANPDLIIEIAGHTDNKGSDEYNQRLSQKRAESVRAYLIKKSISPKRVFAKGYGEKSPIAFNDTDEGRQKNRRTEVRIIKQ